MRSSSGRLFLGVLYCLPESARLASFPPASGQNSTTVEHHGPYCGGPQPTEAAAFARQAAFHVKPIVIFRVPRLWVFPVQDDHHSSDWIDFWCSETLNWWYLNGNAVSVYCDLSPQRLDGTRDVLGPGHSIVDGTTHMLRQQRENVRLPLPTAPGLLATSLS